jgi:hypothetical protein
MVTFINKLFENTTEYPLLNQVDLLLSSVALSLKLLCFNFCLGSAGDFGWKWQKLV